MTQAARRARVVHAIPGRLRIRFEDDGPAPATEALAAARVAPGVLAIDAKPASRSIVVQYDPARTTPALVIVELERAGIDMLPSEAVRGGTTSAPPDRTGQSLQPPDPTSGAESGSRPIGRDVGGRYQRQREAPDSSEPAADPGADPRRDGSGQRSELLEMLIGPPPKLDRRFAESITLSLVSLLAARRVGTALGGGTTLPAYFAIWFALRQLTGFGRRR